MMLRSARLITQAIKPFRRSSIRVNSTVTFTGGNTRSSAATEKIPIKVEFSIDKERASRIVTTKEIPHFDAAGYEYIRTIGNRPSELKERLRLETAALFNSNVVMLSTPEQGELMRFLVQISNATKGIEVGTFTGMSSLSLAEGFRNKESSMLYTLDLSDEFTNVAKRYWKEAGVDRNVHLILGDAVDSLEKLASDSEHTGTFDFAFLDGKKADYLKYTELCLKLLKPGGFIILDNVMWSGKVVDDTKKMSLSTKTLRRVAELLNKDERVDICMLPMSDGVSLVYKR